MAFRGRGRGRGGWGGRGGMGGFAKQEPFVLFPDVVLPQVKCVTEERTLAAWNSKFRSYWKSSPYYLEEAESKKSQSTDIERFSDRTKPRTKVKRGALDQFLLYESDKFPKELIEGSRKQNEQPNQKKVRWNPNSDMQRLDLFEKLEKQFQGEEGKDGKEKKKGEDEEEVEDEGLEEAEEEYSDDGDYNQNVDFDDDEDDFNMEDDNEDEATY